MTDQSGHLTPDVGRYVVEKVMEILEQAKDGRTVNRAARMVVKMVKIDRQAEKLQRTIDRKR
jgi:hypothetical protein